MSARDQRQSHHRLTRGQDPRFFYAYLLRMSKKYSTFAPPFIKTNRNMKKLLLIFSAAICLIACKPNGQDPTNYTKAYLIGLKVMSVQYNGYTYWFEILDQNGQAIDATLTNKVYNASCPVVFRAVNHKILDVTNTIYQAKLITQEAGGKVPFAVFSDGEIGVFPMLKILGYPEELTFYDQDGTRVVGVYTYE